MLKLYPREEQVCYMPGPKTRGAAPPYVGRKTVQPSKPGEPVRHVARMEPAEVDPNHPEDATRKRAVRLMKLCRDGALWPADKATADACGVPFVAVEHDGENWVRATPKPAAKAAKKADD